MATGLRYDASAHRYFPEVFDKVTGKKITIRVIDKKLYFTYRVGAYDQNIRVTLTTRKGQFFHSVELLTIPPTTVPWAQQEEGKWAKVGGSLTAPEFRTFLQAQRLPADDLILALHSAMPD